MNWYELAEKQLWHDYQAGLISQAEYNEEMRQLNRDYRDAAAEAAWGAYERELDNW